MEYTDPIRGDAMNFALLQRSALRNSPYQRNQSKGLVSKLLNSVAKGFVVPVIVVPDGGGYIVIDGQHRLAAADKIKLDEEYTVPCIVVGDKYKNLPLIYNVEKSDNIKDKCTKAHAYYLQQLGSQTTEADHMAAFSFESYITTLAFAHVEKGLKSPSLVESPVKKLDTNFLTDLVDVAVEERRRMAGLAVDLEETVQDMADAHSITDFNLKRSIISIPSQRLWGRKRNLEITYEEGIAALIDQINGMSWSFLANR